MKRIDASENRPYPILLEDSFSALQGHIRQAINPSSICIITDSHVGPLYLEEIEVIAKQIAPTCSYTLIAGEASKNGDILNSIYKTMVENGMDRSSLIIALGGGVVGDIAGFAAATYMRGIAFIQVPTTVLAQNDSSMGGKVGIDYLNYKNMVGAFFNPILIYMNISVLKTLPQRELIGGMAEVIKHGLIYDPLLFNHLKVYKQDILAVKYEAVEAMTYQSCKVKCKVVEEDHKELGLRKILNFGHTIGHAIETLSNFEYSHGECVAYGMCMAAFISQQRNYLSEEKLAAVVESCKLFGLLKPINHYTTEEIWENMSHDKKKSHGKIAFILLKDIGETIIVKDINQEEVKQAIEFIEKTCQ